MSGGTDAPSVPDDAARDQSVTRVLARLVDGDEAVAEDLYRLVYDELHAHARRCLRGRPQDPMLQPTLIVNSAFLKLIEQTRARWNDSQHFYRVAARAMRRIVTDFVRRESAARRGHGQPRLPLGEIEGEAGTPIDLILDLDALLDELADRNERLARVVELRFYAGLGLDELATALGVSKSTVKGDWEFARTWLHEKLCD